MMGLLESDWGKPVVKPPQTEWIEKAEVVREYWAEKLGSYAETSSGIDNATFTEINESRAEARVDRMDELIELGKAGALNQWQIDDIKKAYRRVPREFKE
jgi:hypothetical protein